MLDPASMLFVLGAPIQTWLAWDPVVVRALGAPAGIAIDLVAVLLPTGAAAWISTERRAVDRARVVGAGVVLALILAWQLPVAISETSVSVGLVAFLLGFATLWPIEGIRRVIAFSVIALAVSRFGTILIFTPLHPKILEYKMYAPAWGRCWWWACPAAPTARS